MAKRRAPATAEALLQAIRERPEQRVALFAAALSGPGEEAIAAALEGDRALRGELRRAVGDLRQLDQAPWLVQYAERADLREAIPELVRVACADRGSESEQAADVLLAFADRKALAALARRVESQSWVVRASICALFALGEEVAWKRLSPLVAAGAHAGAMALWHVGEAPEIARRDPRWIEAAVEALGGRNAEAARALLARALTPQLRRRLFARSRPAVVPSPASPESLAAARAFVDSLLSKLPPLPRPRPATARRLGELETILGQVPPMVRAVHERIDGVDVRAGRPRDRVVLFSTAYVLRAARAWEREHDPRRTPSELVPRFRWPVAPDGFTRAGMSGGPDHGFEAPGAGDDPILDDTPGKPCYSRFVARELRRAGRAARSR
jgi:hypothetical protein